ncbi:SMI1/KNR4 family protein [Pendulispora brunnea]|uniref:SMI1/KNR4 family protein n=1 Tax=Pendulispora brunnea TaxID=2905690 RepID=UPI00374E0A6F
MGTVKFVECDPPATQADVDELERRLGFRVPRGVRHLLTNANGGRPEPSTFRSPNVCTDVSACLTLRDGRGSIWWAYDLLILSKKAAPNYYLPFAYDSGGNDFLVDCRSDEGPVAILYHDPNFEVQELGVNLAEFWDHLTS